MAAASKAPLSLKNEKKTQKTTKPEDFGKFFTEQKVKGENVWVLMIRTTKDSSKNRSNQVNVGQKAVAEVIKSASLDLGKFWFLLHHWFLLANFLDSLRFSSPIIKYEKKYSLTLQEC